MSDKSQPNYTGDYPGLRRVEQWALVDILYGGTYEVRAHRELTLPQFPAEHDDVYNERVELATFDNDYRDTLEGLIGIIFRKPMIFKEDVPEAIRKVHLENIDLAGTHIDVFVTRLARKAIQYGGSYVSVDIQKVPEGVRVEDDAQAKALNLRPYWTIYAAPDVQSKPRYVAINGIKTLQQIVLREHREVPDGLFGSAIIEQYRVWRLPVRYLPTGAAEAAGPVVWEVWREEEVESGTPSKKRKEFRIADQGVTHLTRIPVAPLIVEPDLDDPTMIHGPALIDLAYLCVKDFQQISDHEANLHLCNSPIPWASGLQDDSKLTQVAWGKGVMFTLDLGGACGYAEPTGGGLEAFDRQLKQNKTKIRQKGLEMVLNEEVSNVETTATEQRFRQAKRTSRLASTVTALQDCLELALDFHAEWMKLGLDAGGSIEMGVKGDEVILTAAEVAAFSELVDRRQLSIRSMYTIFNGSDLFKRPLDVEEEIAQILAEQEKLAPAADTPSGGNPEESGEAGAAAAAQGMG